MVREAQLSTPPFRRGGEDALPKAVTADTSQPEMSALNAGATRNMSCGDGRLVVMGMPRLCRNLGGVAGHGEESCDGRAGGGANGMRLYAGVGRVSAGLMLGAGWHS